MSVPPNLHPNHEQPPLLPALSSQKHAINIHYSLLATNDLLPNRQTYNDSTQNRSHNTTSESDGATFDFEFVIRQL